MLRNEYFIVDEGDVISIYTFVWFSPEMCNQMQLVLVNKFSKKAQKWRHNNFGIEKFTLLLFLGEAAKLFCAKNCRK